MTTAGMESAARELVTLQQQQRQLHQLLDQLERVRAAFPEPPDRSEWSGVSRLAFDLAHGRLKGAISSAIVSVSRAGEATERAVVTLLADV